MSHWPQRWPFGRRRGGREASGRTGPLRVAGVATVLGFSVLVVSAATESTTSDAAAPAPSLEESVARLQRGIDEIAELLRRLVSQGDMELLLRRIEIGQLRLSPAETRLATLRRELQEAQAGRESGVAQARAWIEEQVRTGELSVEEEQRARAEIAMSAKLEEQRIELLGQLEADLEALVLALQQETDDLLLRLERLERSYRAP